MGGWCDWTARDDVTFSPFSQGSQPRWDDAFGSARSGNLKKKNMERSYLGCASSCLFGEHGGCERRFKYIHLQQQSDSWTRRNY